MVVSGGKPWTEYADIAIENGGKVMRKKMSELRDLMVVGSATTMSVAVCIANIVRLNIFAVVVSFALIVVLGFAFGYTYAAYEAKRKSDKAREARELLMAEKNIEDTAENDIG